MEFGRHASVELLKKSWKIIDTIDPNHLFLNKLMEIGRDASIEFLKKFLEITSKCKSRITIVSFDLGHIIILVFCIQLSMYYSKNL